MQKKYVTLYYQEQKQRVYFHLGWYRGHSARGGAHHVRGPQLRECGRAQDVLCAGGGLRGHELHPRVSHCASRRHEGAGLLPRHQPVPGGHLGPHCRAPQPPGGP